MNLFWRVLPCERQHFFCFLYFERFRIGVFWVRAGFKWLIICDLSVGVKETQFSCILFKFFVSLQADTGTMTLINYMKRAFAKNCLMLLAMGLLTACSSDDELQGTGHGTDSGVVNTPTVDNNDDEVQGYWGLDGFVEMIPQNAAPYTLLIKWDDEKGKVALGQYIADNKDVVLDRIDFGKDDQCYLITTKVVESQDFFVSTSYKTKTMTAENDYITVLPRIVVKLGGDNNINPILEKYADVMTLDDDLYASASQGRYMFKCHLNTSREVLQLASEIHQNANVEWAEPEMYIPFKLTE